jgi:hypothetical protein
MVNLRAVLKFLFLDKGVTDVFVDEDRKSIPALKHGSRKIAEGIQELDGILELKKKDEKDKMKAKNKLNKQLGQEMDHKAEDEKVADKKRKREKNSDKREHATPPPRDRPRNSAEEDDDDSGGGSVSLLLKSANAVAGRRAMSLLLSGLKALDP